MFNPGTKIPTKGKHLWTFYGPDGKHWNHYGDLEMMGYDDKPTDPYRPQFARYRGKIYPVNRIHSAWPAIQVEGETALMQPKMGDIYKMWTSHPADATKYPKLSKITDDNGDDSAHRRIKFAARMGKVVDAIPDTRLGRHIAGQLVRCGTSPAPNYAEARGAESKKDFIHNDGDLRKGVARITMLA